MMFRRPSKPSKSSKSSPNVVFVVFGDSDSKTRSTQEFLKKLNIGDFELHLINDEGDKNKVVSTQDFLEQLGVSEFAIKTADVKAEGNHRRISRMIVLLTVIPMSTIIPVWLLVLLTLSGLGHAKFSEQLQLGLIGAGILDCFGLCYIVTSDLFPNGKSSKGSRSKNSDSDQEVNDP